ncbi:Nn.00g117960.m01.CDS01 [Neocucurbitaria sp. VM-36]
MATPGQNRYALFAEEDDNTSPLGIPAVDISSNPFVNQVVDDSIPWQEVKKRSALSGLSVNQNTGTKQVPKGRAKPVQDRDFASQSRLRITSISTTGSSDKVYDAHENWCGVCSQKFSSKTALVNHIKQTPQHQHYCNLCKRVFKDRNGLKNHVDHSHGHEIFCNLCLSAFKDEWGLKNHFENNYHVEHQFVCLTCLLGFRSQVELDRHLQTAEKHTWCGTCHRRFRNQDERDEHWQKTMKHKHCLQPGCNFDGPDQATLTEHLQRDHFQCEGCKYILPSQTKLRQHHELCSFPLSCPQCGEVCAGQAQMALHLEQCYFCDECGFHTQHEGNYRIHMAKHTSTSIPCWGCDAPMRTYSGLINHLESKKCPNLPESSLLMLCLGKWWYSSLYMDLDIHAQIRTGRINLDEVQQWMDDGLLRPFVCRDEGCMDTFGHLISLVLHCESQACNWGIARLNMIGLEKEVKQICVRRDSAME